jgi:hypothetical protein
MPPNPAPMTSMVPPDGVLAVLGPADFCDVIVFISRLARQQFTGATDFKHTCLRSAWTGAITSASPAGKTCA